MHKRVGGKVFQETLMVYPHQDPRSCAIILSWALEKYILFF